MILRSRESGRCIGEAARLLAVLESELGSSTEIFAPQTLTDNFAADNDAKTSDGIKRCRVSAEHLPKALAATGVFGERF